MKTSFMNEYKKQLELYKHQYTSLLNTESLYRANLNKQLYEVSQKLNFSEKDNRQMKIKYELLQNNFKRYQESI